MDNLLFLEMVLTIYLYYKIMFQANKVGYVITDYVLKSKPVS